ncbi:MAG: hypothetical protein ABL949_13805 [Fimbriimonadaceae bacterium]
MDHRFFASEITRLAGAQRTCPICKRGTMSKRGPVVEMSRSQQFDPNAQSAAPTYATLGCDSCHFTEFYELTGIKA